MLWPRLLLAFFALALLAGCESASRREEDAVPAAAVEPVRQPLEARWRQGAADLDLERLLSRFHGAALRRAVRRAATTPLPPKQVAAHLEAARAHARGARAIVAELYGYRKAGGVQLSAEEKALWARLAGGRSGEEPETVDDFDLVRARQSLAVQTGKAWFHLQGIRRLRLRATEVRELRQQMVERHRTSNRLERGDRDGVLAARKDLARADARVKRLEQAERLAFKALARLSGGKRIPEGAASVSPVPAALPLEQLVQRSDLHLAVARLERGGMVPSWPAVEVTAGRERGTRELSALARLEDRVLAERLGLRPGSDEQEAVALEFAAAVRAALRDVKNALYRVRQLLMQHDKMQQRLQQARREVNRLRARYSARRVRLLEILEAQVTLTEIAGRAAYVERRVQDQRLEAHFALGMP